MGVGLAPAHRGLVVLVVEDLALADFGNRIPNITAEITFARVPQYPTTFLDLITTSEGGILDSYQRDELAIDWQRGFGYLLDSSSDPAQAGIRRFDLRSMREDRQARMSQIAQDTPDNFPSTLFCGRDGYLYLTAGSGNSRPILRVEPNALTEVDRFGYYSSGLSNTDKRFVATTWMAMISAYGPTGRSDYLMTGSIFDDLGLLSVRSMSYVWGEDETVEESRIRGLVGGAVREGSGDGWILGSGTSTNHTSLGLYRLRVSTAASFDPLSTQSLGVGLSKMLTLTPESIAPGATGFFGTAGGLTYDPADDSVIFQVRLSEGGSPGDIYTVKWRSDVGIVWKTITPFQVNYEGAFSHSRLQRSRWTLMRGSRICQINTITGALEWEITWPTGINEFGAQVYDSLNDMLLVVVTSGIVRLALNRGAGEGVGLGAVVTDLCARAGLTAADVDVSDLTATVPGYVIGRQTTVRGALETLSQAWGFDATESDDQLRFRLRGRDPVMTLPAEELVPLDERTGETWRERRLQEVELPERVSVIYMDRGADYTQGTQSAKRIAQPTATMASRSQVSLDLALALDAERAKEIATRSLNTAWLERSIYEAMLTSAALRLDPTDVIEVVFASGTTFRTRITQLDVGADYALSLRGVSEAVPLYVAQFAADTGAGTPAQVIAAQATTRLFLPDLPLLRDSDDTGGAGSRRYVLMAGYGAPGWPGAGLYHSTDGSAWAQVARGVQEAAWGAAVNALGAPRSPFATDEDNHLTVFMTTGADRLESVTQEALVNGANGAMLLRSDGTAEVLQFRDVTQNADGSMTLSGLLRGRRGTELWTQGHVPGAAFVLLDPDDIEHQVTALSEIGLPRSWKAVGLGTRFEDAEIQRITPLGRDLMPYAPCHLRVAPSADPAGIQIIWVRRTRLGGALRDGTGEVPLGEASEAYEVDILDGPAGVVLRTLSSATPSVVYAEADMLADFGAVPASLTLSVYQISAAIGRGFASSTTLEITP